MAFYGLTLLGILAVFGLGCLFFRDYGFDAALSLNVVVFQSIFLSTILKFVFDVDESDLEAGQTFRVILYWVCCGGVIYGLVCLYKLMT